MKSAENIAEETRTECSAAYVVSADRYARRANTEAIAATTAATAEITQITVVIMKRFLSVLSRDAGVSTNWFNSSTPGI